MFIAVLIDGAYLEKVLVKVHNMPRLDLFKFVERILEETRFRDSGAELTLLRTYYFHAEPWFPSDQGRMTDEHKERLDNKRSFFNRLEMLPRFQVELGRTRRFQSEEGAVTYVQKGVDVRMAIRLVNLASTHKITHAVLVTADEDLVPAVETAKEHGCIVYNVFGAGAPHSSELAKAADEIIPFDEEFVTSCLQEENY